MEGECKPSSFLVWSTKLTVIDFFFPFFAVLGPVLSFVHILTHHIASNKSALEGSYSNQIRVYPEVSLVVIAVAFPWFWLLFVSVMTISVCVLLSLSVLFIKLKKRTPTKPCPQLNCLLPWPCSLCALWRLQCLLSDRQHTSPLQSYCHVPQEATQTDGLFSGKVAVLLPFILNIL